MSKMIFNGLEFVAGQEINNNGIFVDTDNLIVAETTYSGSFSYTATQDCMVVVNFCGSSSGSGWIMLDGVVIGRIYTTSGVGISGDTYFVKKGQTISAASQVISGVNLTYTVYGLQSGTISNVQHNYSTSEQLIGTWIDGKQLYEKTVSFTTGNANAYLNYVTDIENPEMMSIDFSASFYVTEDAMVNATPYFGTLETRDSNAFAVLCNKVDNKLRLDYRVGSSAYSKSALVTVRYTKTTD